MMEKTTATVMTTTAPQETVNTNNNAPIVSPFSSIESFTNAYRMSKCLAASTLVPDNFMRNEANCMIALELAARFGYSPFLLMQNLYVIHGRPGFSSQFIIAAIQSCGRYGALHYRWTTDKEGNKVGCRAEAKELSSGEILTGSEVTLEMAKKEGWSTKTGSKWLTMPEQMMMYRAAAFFGRLYAPDILLGIRSDDELIDMESAPTAKYQPDNLSKKRNMTDELNAMVEPVVVEVEEVKEVKEVKENPPVAEEPKAESEQETKREMKPQTKVEDKPKTEEKTKTEEKPKTESKTKSEQIDKVTKAETKTTENPSKAQSRRGYSQQGFAEGFDF